MPPEKAEFLRQWLRKAKEDIEMAEAALCLVPPLTEPSLFHTQQAAEKSFKAFLTFHDVAFRKIHDLSKLGKLILKKDKNLESLVEKAQALTPFAVEIRYPGEDEPPSLLEAKENLLLAKQIYEKINSVLTKNQKLADTAKPTDSGEVKKLHPWRLCPGGQHWVVTHPLHIPPSKRHPKGGITTRHEHCANNPSGKDIILPGEIIEIGENSFSDLKANPCSIDLGFKGLGDKYDSLIAGWTQYWNDLFPSKSPLEPDVVKALIASESGFNATKLAKKTNSNSARGLMQLTNDTRKTLGNEKGELHDHFISATKEQLNDPSVNICAGIRWLFQKKRLASGKIGHEASWEEAIANYKGKLDEWKSGSGEGKKEMNIFNSYLARLQKCKES